MTDESLVTDHGEEDHRKIIELKVLGSPDGKRMAERLYHTFLGKEDFGRFPSFLAHLDQLLVDYGSKGVKTGEDREEEADASEEERASVDPLVRDTRKKLVKGSSSMVEHLLKNLGG